MICPRNYDAHKLRSDFDFLTADSFRETLPGRKVCGFAFDPQQVSWSPLVESWVDGAEPDGQFLVRDDP